MVSGLDMQKLSGARRARSLPHLSQTKLVAFYPVGPVINYFSYEVRVVDFAY